MIYIKVLDANGALVCRTAASDANSAYLDVPTGGSYVAIANTDQFALAYYSNNGVPYQAVFDYYDVIGNAIANAGSDRYAVLDNANASVARSNFAALPNIISLYGPLSATVTTGTYTVAGSGATYPSGFVYGFANGCSITIDGRTFYSQWDNTYGNNINVVPEEDGTYVGKLMKNGYSDFYFYVVSANTTANVSVHT